MGKVYQVAADTAESDEEAFLDIAVAEARKMAPACLAAVMEGKSTAESGKEETAKTGQLTNKGKTRLVAEEELEVTGQDSEEEDLDEWVQERGDEADLGESEEENRVEEELEETGEEMDIREEMDENALPGPSATHASASKRKFGGRKKKKSKELPPDSDDDPDPPSVYQPDILPMNRDGQGALKTSE
ncbi:uncharacterized protein LOC110978145 [Acanthaster planci]|uniref:Uncharacterized protein LOC110978145 n=1 Tax=Acanthaster planci TaxID=133434 RepID=A0A8B7YA66_ACAPL|nr:uncharacterized protein LOC110978145 [Acanthaster planci]